MYRHAFLSYASENRIDVLRVAQGLRAANPRLTFFQDIDSLRPGDDWKAEIIHHIDACDLFLLFWSTPASKSEMGAAGGGAGQ